MMGPDSVGNVTSYNLDDVPDGDRVYSSDGKRVAAFWRKHSDNLYDHDTICSFVVWHAPTGLVAETYTRIHSTETVTSERRGKPVRAIRFDEASRLIIVFDDGTEEPAKPEMPV